MAATGVCAGFVYDLVRVLRRMVPHNSLALQLEDMVYWVLFTMFAMLVLLWEDNGTFRIFSALAPVIGMILYFGFLSRFFMPPILFVARLIKKLSVVILHIFCLPLELFGKLLELPVRKIKKIIYKFNKIAKKLLKKIWKCAKITSGLRYRKKNDKK